MLAVVLVGLLWRHWLEASVVDRAWWMSLDALDVALGTGHGDRRRWAPDDSRGDGSVLDVDRTGLGMEVDRLAAVGSVSGG